MERRNTHMNWHLIRWKTAIYIWIKIKYYMREQGRSMYEASMNRRKIYKTQWWIEVGTHVAGLVGTITRRTITWPAWSIIGLAYVCQYEHNMTEHICISAYDKIRRHMLYGSAHDISRKHLHMDQLMVNQELCTYGPAHGKPGHKYVYIAQMKSSP